MDKKLSNIVEHYNYWLEYISESGIPLTRKQYGYLEIINSEGLLAFWSKVYMKKIIKEVLNTIFMYNDSINYFEYTKQEEKEILLVLRNNPMFNDLLNDLVDKNENNLKNIESNIEEFKIGDKVTTGTGISGTIVSIYNDEATVLVDYSNGPTKPYLTEYDISSLIHE